MSVRIAPRLRGEQGFTLIEVLIVLILMMILVTIAAPSYLRFRARANTSAAQTNLHNMVPGLVQWYGMHNDGYASVTVTKLRLSYNVAMKDVSIFYQAASNYCLKSKVGTEVWYKGGPSGGFTATVPHPSCGS